MDSVLAGARAFVSVEPLVPISILEGRQHGLPMVLTDIPGHLDGADTSPAAFVPSTTPKHSLSTPSPCSATLAPRRPGTTSLRGEWARYAREFLAIVAAAARTVAASQRAKSARAVRWPSTRCGQT
ncbi:hypothetical protein [Streptomyces sp. NPDC088183]|uniref:hypothetical protein n=1 Tax=Streptomyces sp. NPDC088183 TaxID=3160992 RepID=UPI0034346EFB